MASFGIAGLQLALRAGGNLSQIAEEVFIRAAPLSVGPAGAASTEIIHVAGGVAKLSRSTSILNTSGDAEAAAGVTRRRVSAPTTARPQPTLPKRHPTKGHGENGR